MSFSPRRVRRHRYRATIPLAWWFVLGVVAGCEDTSVEPNRPHTTFIIVGDTVQGSMPPSGDQVRFEFQAANNYPYAVFLQATGSRMQITASDTSESVGLGYSQADPGLDLLDRATGPFQFGNGRVRLLVSSTGAGSFRLFVYRIHEEPESHALRFAIGDTVTETLETLADIDTFVVSGTAGQELVGYAEALDVHEPGIVSVDIESLANVLGMSGDSDLQQSSTGRFALPATRDYGVKVHSGNGGSGWYRGPYRFQLRPVNSAPEHHAATLAVGDTVTGEAIDYVGDVDAFTLTGSPGQECIVFLQGRNGNPASLFVLEVLDSSGLAVTSSVSNGADTGFFGLAQMTARVQIPTAGPAQLRLRVRGGYDQLLRDRGAYRFWAYGIDRRPETAPETLPFGDSVLTEAITVPGDIDEFHLVVPDSSGANLVVRQDPNASGGPLQLRLLDAGGQLVTELDPWTPDTILSTGPMALAPGTYTVQVEGYQPSPGDRTQYVGGFRLWLYKFGFGPEIAPDTIQIGDTISTEALDPPGDMDVFWFYGRRGDHINIALQGEATPEAGEFVVQFGDPGQIPTEFVVSPLHTDSLGTYESNRIDLTRTGWYSLNISGFNNARGVWEQGAYRFAITTRGTAPEHVSAALVPGDSVTGESIDYPGDWDEFTITGTPGQFLAIVARTDTVNRYPTLEVFDSSTGVNIASVVPLYVDRATAVFSLPASGQLQLAIYQPRSPSQVGGAYDFMHPYQFVVVPVNPAPENVPATVTLGDTVRGEAIFPATDIDEFQGVGTPGQTLAPWYRLTANVIPPGTEISLQIVDPGTGAVLTGGNFALVGPSTDFFSPGQFQVPASGNYLVVVANYSLGELATAPYEFFIASSP